MYPSAIQTWNLGPDTTSLVQVFRGPISAGKPCTPDNGYKGIYKCIVGDKYNYYRIPTTFEKGEYIYDLIVKVRNDKDGFLKAELNRLRKERGKIKKDMKSCLSAEYEALNSQQYAIKVILNSVYGVLGLKSSSHGDMISACMVTAMCRWTTGQVINRFKDILIELDTDGLMLTEKVDEKAVNTWLTTLVKERFNIDDNYMSMELDTLGRVFFLAMKNYVVQDGDKYKIHGSSIFSSRSSHVIDRAINLAIEFWFNNKPKQEVLDEAYDFDGLTLVDFEQRIRLSKEQQEYDDQLAMQISLAKQMEEKTKQVVTEGTQITYLITKELPKGFEEYYRGGWKYSFCKYVNSIDELDLKFYKENIEKILTKFGITDDPQCSFLDELIPGASTRIAKKFDKIEAVKEEL